MDLDDFKRVNDTYGHNYGDNVLKYISILLRESLSRNLIDSAYRWGGEEFMILLPETHLTGAYYVAEKIRKNLEIYSKQNLKSKITGSFGISSILTNSRVNSEELFKEADENVYTTKNSGKNKVYPPIKLIKYL